LKGSVPLLSLLFLVACTEAALVTPPGGDPGVRDNKLKLTGRICTTDATDVVAPLKVLFVIDTSGSMNVSDPVSQTVADPMLQTGRSRAVFEAINDHIKLNTDLSALAYCNTGDTDCYKGSTSCPACGPSGGAMCIGPDCCSKPTALCKGVPACTTGTNAACVPLCSGDADCQGLGGHCTNGVCSQLLDPGVEFAIMRFGSAKQVLTQNSDKQDGFTNDPRQLLAAIPQVSNGGSVTDYEGALSMAAEVISSDVQRLKQNSAAALVRTRYLVFFLSDGRPDPQVNDEDDWGHVPCHTQADLLDITLADPGSCTSDPVLAAARQAIQEYNLPNRVLQRVKDLVALRALFGLAEVRLHTAYLSGAEDGQVEGQSVYLLKQMAELGRGTFSHFGNHKAISFKAGFSSMKRVFALKSLLASNLSARSVAGKLLLDSDADGLQDGVELQAGTNATLADTDRDGFSDALEHFYRGSGWDALDPSDADCPLLQDADGDKRPDDSDGDGLLDCEERIIGTHRDLFDTDGDGLPDGIEVMFGTNPGAQDGLDDPDVDGLSNADEVRLHTDPWADDAAHRSRAGYRYSLQQVGTGIEQLALPCIADRDCPSSADCREGYCRCVADAGCSTRTPCQDGAACTWPGERCSDGQCTGAHTCQAPSAAVEGSEMVCAAKRNITCYSYAVENIALVPTLAGPQLSAGWNRIQLYAGEAPLDSPSDPGTYRVACVMARYTVTESGDYKLPASGEIEVPAAAWVDPARVETYLADTKKGGGREPCGTTHYCDAGDRCIDAAHRRCRRSICVCPDGAIGDCLR